TSTAHFALEEPESHLHPKVQSRLAHWLVSLAMCNRRMMVETHSDHLVRRLRGLIARSAPGSELESWLLENVVVLEVNQAEDGSSSVVSSRLTRDGSLSESWPADFMDEGSEEDTAIFEAALAKKPRQPRRAASFIHDEGDEDEP
ncbi:MAG TPA: AAA family ATPase, partial [Myxococcota bacterium]|nr:AAA family ATPase [Myxococcota bacterium]